MVAVDSRTHLVYYAGEMIIYLPTLMIGALRTTCMSRTVSLPAFAAARLAALVVDIYLY